MDNRLSIRDQIALQLVCDSYEHVQKTALATCKTFDQTNQVFTAYVLTNLQRADLFLKAIEIYDKTTLHNTPIQPSELVHPGSNMVRL